MKKRLKGLASLWLVAAMLCSYLTVPVMAADEQQIYVYTGSEALSEGSIVSDLVETQVALDTALDEQESLMEELIAPAGSVLQGWNLWERIGCGTAVSDKVALEKSGEISAELYNSAWYEYAPLLEPLWQVMYRISQQPAEENNYTVKGQILSEDSWTDTDDAAYQWYLYGEKNLSYPVTNTADADAIEAITCWEGTYDEDAECWTGSVENSSSAVIDIVFPVEKGDVITVELSDNFAGTVEEYFGEEYEAEDGVYTMEITESGYHNIYISDGAADRFTAVITVSRTLPDHTRMDGQDSVSLDTSDLESGTYFCEVTFDPDGDKCVIDSETAEYTKPDAPVGKTGVYIGGLELSSVGYYKYDTETDTLNVGSAEDYNAYLTWDAENGYVLTIKDLTVDADSPVALRSENDLTLIVEGMNILTGSDNDATDGGSCGVLAEKNLVIDGRGTLRATANTGAASSAGIAVFAGNLTIEGGTITATAGTGSVSSVGITTLDGDLTINGGTITATAGEAQNGYSFGIGVTGDLLIKRGTINATGGKAIGGNSYGIGATGTVTINGGTVTATAGYAEAAQRLVYAMRAGAQLYAAAPNYNYPLRTSGISFGLVTYSSIYITGGRLNAIGGDSSVSSVGLCSNDGSHDGEIRITGGRVMAKSGKGENGFSFGIGTGTLLVRNANVEAFGGMADNGGSFGIGATDGVDIRGSQLRAIGGKAYGTPSDVPGGATIGYSFGIGCGSKENSGTAFFNGDCNLYLQGESFAVGTYDFSATIGEGEYTLYANEEVVESVDDWSEVWLFIMEQSEPVDDDDDDDDEKKKHRCTSECGICGGCLDEDCREKVCRTKCVLFDMDFEDVQDGKWYSEAVEYVYHRGLMTGDGSGLFDIGGTTTRAMVVSILWRLEGEPEAIYALDYDDVAEGKWYTEAVRWAAAEDVASGYGNGRFGVNDPITREQLASMLYRYEQYKGGGFVGAWMFRLQHPDAAEVSAWAYEPMCWMTMNGILNGDEAGMLNPRDTASRAELAQILMGYLEK